MWLHNKCDIKQIILGADARNKGAIRAYKKIDFKEKQTPYIDITDENQLTMVWNVEE
jgi:RimJ/RimL family protein N-acetyltransferase